MKLCPACEQGVSPVWPTCRTCGALLMAPPPPLAYAGAAPASASATVGASRHSSAPSRVDPPTNATAPGTATEIPAEEQFFAPATLLPTATGAPAEPAESVAPVATWASTRVGTRAGADVAARTGPGKWIALIATIGFVVAAVAIALVTFGGAGTDKQTPEALAPRAATAGLPTSLPDVVRIQAESTRRTALQAVQRLGRGDPGALADDDPDFAWVPGDEPSSDAHQVSVMQNGVVVTLAVAASNHDVCAFAQWQQGGTPHYVTMAHQPRCAAVDAPTTGWSSEAGGAASDLPDDKG
jgi:hypothetical protein